MWVVKSFCVGWFSWHRGQGYIWSEVLGSTMEVDEMGGGGIPGGKALAALDDEDVEACGSSASSSLGGERLSS